MCQSSFDNRDRILQRSTSQGSIGSPVYNRHGYTPTLSRSPQHFHRPGGFSTGLFLFLCVCVCLGSSSFRSPNSGGSTVCSAGATGVPSPPLKWLLVTLPINGTDVIKYGCKLTRFFAVYAYNSLIKLTLGHQQTFIHMSC